MDMFLEQKTGTKYLTTLKIIDYVSIILFTHLFYIGIMGTLYGNWIGGIWLFITWEFWKIYEQYRQENP